MVIDNKLNHLSEDEIQEVIELYENTLIPVKEILETYNINIQASRLVYILPPEKTKISCPYCDSVMFKKRKSRSIDSNFYKAVIECFECGHVMYENKNMGEKECNCINCKEKERQEIINKKEIIKRLYGNSKEMKKIEEVKFKDIEELIYILSYYKLNNGLELQPVRNAFYGNKKLKDIVCNLLENNILAVSPNTDIEAFDEDDFPRIVKVSLATYRINIDIDSVDDIYTYAHNNKSFDEMKIKLLKQYIFKDIIMNMKRMMRERGLELEVTKSGSIRLEKLIDKISYTKIIHLCLKVARHYSDKVITHKVYRAAANKVALSTVYTFYENAENNNWSLYDVDYNEYVGERLEIYIKRVLGKRLDLLKNVARNDSLDTVENCV